MLVKICTLCKIIKPVVDFYKASREKDGLQHRCKACDAKTGAAYRSANREKDKQRHAKYHEANKAKLNKKTSDWQKANPDNVRTKARKFYHAHKESEATRMKAWAEKNPNWKREYIKQWRQENVAKCRTSESKRRAARLLATPSWANEDNILAIYAESYRLSRSTGIKHHVDHIVPLQSPIVCGLHCEDNLRAIPALENWKKRNLRWPDMP